MRKEAWHGNFKSYVVGFLLSVALTLAAYFFVQKEMLVGWILIAAIVACAIVQTYVQLVLFLHIGDEPKPRWNLLTFITMGVIVAILVVGSLWIMNHLEYNMMPMLREGM